MKKLTIFYRYVYGDIEHEKVLFGCLWERTILESELVETIKSLTERGEKVIVAVKEI